MNAKLDLNQIYLSASMMLSDDQEGAKKGTLSGVAYSGSAVRSKYGEKYVVDLAGVSFSAPMPLLYEHKEPVGVIHSIENDGKQLKINAQLFVDDNEQAANIYKMAKNEFPWQLSVGIYDCKYTEKKGAAMTLNGINYPEDHDLDFVLTSCHLREVSVAVLGVDHKTNAQILSNDPAANEVNLAIKHLSDERDSLVMQLSAARDELASIKAEHEAAEAARKQQVRLSAISSLKQLSPASISESNETFLLRADDAVFEVFESLVKTLSATSKPNLPAHLFSATHREPENKQELSTQNIYDQRKQSLRAN